MIKRTRGSFTMSKLVTYLLQYWNGNLSLRSAFFFVFIPVSVSWHVFKSFAKTGITNDYVSIYHPMIIFVLILGGSISIYRFVGLWRCSKNTDRRILKLVSRSIALIVFTPSMIAMSLLTYSLIYNLF